MSPHMSTRTPDAWTDQLVRGMYRRSARWMCDTFALVPTLRDQRFAGFVPVETGIAFGVNSDFQVPNSRESVIVGGACLSYCDGDLRKLRADFIIDTLMPLMLAAWSGTPCVIYLPVGEEMIVTEETIDPVRWRQVGDRLEEFIYALADTVNGGLRPVIIRTDAPATSDILDSAADEAATSLDNHELGALYTIRGTLEGSKLPGERRLRQYRRSVVSYLPNVVGQLTGATTLRHVVVGENLHQVKAINTARLIAEGGKLDHVAHLPPPSIGGTNRMARAPEESAIYCLESKGQQAAKIQRMSPPVARYWAWLSPTGRQRPSAGIDGSGDLLSMLSTWRRLLLTHDTVAGRSS